MDTRTGATIAQDDRERLLEILETAKLVADGNLKDARDVLIHAKNGALFVSANSGSGNLERIDLAASVPAQGAVDPIVVPPMRLIKALRALPPGDLAIESNSSWLVLADGSMRVGIERRSAPWAPWVPSKIKAQADALDLITTIDAVRFAMTKDATRLNLNVIRIEDGVAIATDGHRMAIAKAELPLEDALTLHGAGIAAIASAFSDLDGRIQITRRDDHLMVQSRDIALKIRLRASNFVPWRQVIPERFATSAVVDHETITYALRTLRSVSNSMQCHVRTIVDTARAEIVFSHEDHDGIEGWASVPIIGDHCGGSLTLGVDARYMLEAIDHCGPCESVRIDFAGELDPMLVTPVGNNPRGHRHIVMPLRI